MKRDNLLWNPFKSLKEIIKENEDFNNCFNFIRLDISAPEVRNLIKRFD